VLLDLKIDLSITESRDGGFAQRTVQVLTDLIRQIRVRGPCKYFQRITHDRTSSQSFSEQPTCGEWFTVPNFPKAIQAGAEGFEPSNTGSKHLCLTTWPRPKYIENTTAAT